jgi:hypothetical protein
VERANGRAFPVRTCVIDNPGRGNRLRFMRGDQNKWERKEPI